MLGSGQSDGERRDNRVERDLEQLAFPGGKFGRVDLRLGEAVDRADAKACGARAQHAGGGQNRRRLHVGRNQAETANLVARRLHHAFGRRRRAANI